jgi:hypothetical protein
VGLQSYEQRLRRGIFNQKLLTHDPYHAEKRKSTNPAYSLVYAGRFVFVDLKVMLREEGGRAITHLR